MLPRAAKRLLARPDRPTAIVCGSDDLTLGVYRAATDQQLRIPQDLSLVAGSGTPLLSAIPLQMSTMHADYLSLGKLAVQKMLWLMDNPGAVTAADVVPVAFRLGASTGPASAGAAAP